MILSKENYYDALKEYSYNKLPKWVSAAFKAGHLVKVYRVEQNLGYIVIRGKEVEPKLKAVNFSTTSDENTICIISHLVYDGKEYGRAADRYISIEEALQILPKASLVTEKSDWKREDLNLNEGEGEFGCIMIDTRTYLVSSLGKRLLKSQYSVPIPVGRKIVKSVRTEKILSSEEVEYAYDNPWALDGSLKGHGKIDLHTTKITITRTFEDGESDTISWVAKDTLSSRLD